MKIGFNVKKIMEGVISYVNYVLGSIIQNHETRIQAIEDNDWIMISSATGSIEINQEFTEIKMVARVYDTQNITYSFSCTYDSDIFHNSTNGRDEIFITGNPTVNNYGCKFKYSVAENGKQIISVDSCYNGANTIDCVLHVWIKPKPTGTQ